MDFAFNPSNVKINALVTSKSDDQPRDLAIAMVVMFLRDYGNRWREFNVEDMRASLQKEDSLENDLSLLSLGSKLALLCDEGYFDLREEGNDQFITPTKKLIKLCRTHGVAYDTDISDGLGR